MHRTFCRLTRLAPLAPLATALLLAACGGGGGGSGINMPPSSGSPTTAIVSATVASSYSGEELAAFTAFNNARVGCNFGALRQNTLIDHAAFNHVNWMIANNSFSHTEGTGTSGFTGANPGDRLNAVGYTWLSYGEVLAAQTGGTKSGFGLQGARNLLAAPYHLMGLMQGNREIGISVKSGGPLGTSPTPDIIGPGTGFWLAADMASSASMLWQSQAASEVLSYPCDGVTGTAYQLTNESPDPFFGTSRPAISSTNPIGQPVFLQVLAGHTLTIGSASMVRWSDGSPVVLAVVLTAGNDQNHELSGNQAILIPNAPLQPNTWYTVNVSGSNNGSNFQKSFNFQTGS